MTFEWVKHCEVRVYGFPKAQPRARALAIKRCTSGHRFKPDTERCPKCGRRGKVFATTYNPNTAKPWKVAVARAFAEEIARVPLDEPLRVDADFYMPRPKSFIKRVRDAYGGASRNIPRGPVLHPSKPDRDNVDKSTLDAMSDAGLMRDDALVCWGTIRRFYHGQGALPGARITVWVWRPVVK